LFRPYTDRSLVRMLYSDSNSENLVNQTFYTQTTIFSIEYALSELWRSWGIQPFALLGHSIGEYSAAYAAGVFSLEDAVKLVATRAGMMQSLPEGGMMAAVFADEETVIHATEGYEGKVSVAAVNAPENVVISGEKACVESVLGTLKHKNIRFRALEVSHAFHSPLTEPILDKFREEASEIHYSKPGITVISNATGRPARGTDLTCAQYWTDHIRHTVRFHDCMKFFETSDADAFLEIGPKPVLATLGRQCLPDNEEILWLPSLRKGKNEWTTMIESLSALYTGGAEINWQKFDAPYKRRKVVLPSYPFNRQRYAVRRGDMAMSPAAAEDYHPLIGKKFTSPLLKNTMIFESVFNSRHPDFFKGTYHLQKDGIPWRSAFGNGSGCCIPTWKFRFQ